MLKQRIAVTLAVAALAVCGGVASAFADDSGDGSTTLGASTTLVDATGTGAPATSACPAVATGAPSATPGVDEQGTANDVAQAAADVQSESDSQTADDQSGDQQGPNDQSGEQGDNCQAAGGSGGGQQSGD